MAKRKKRSAPKGILTPKERARLPKPIANYEEVTRKAIATWRAQRAQVRLTGLSPERLAGMLARAERAQGQEQVAENGLQVAKDRRLLADAATWKGLLDLKAQVETSARRNPALLTSFKLLLKFLERAKRNPAPPPKSSPTAV